MKIPVQSYHIERSFSPCVRPVWPCAADTVPLSALNLSRHHLISYFDTLSGCRVVTYSRIVSPGMKREMTTNSRHARSVRPDTSEYIFTCFTGGPCAPSLLHVGFRLSVTLTAMREARGHAARIVGIVVVDRAIVVDIYEIVGVASARRAQPPPSSGKIYSA